MNAFAMPHPVTMLPASIVSAPARTIAPVAVPRNPIAPPRVNLHLSRRRSAPLSLSWVGLAR